MAKKAKKKYTSIGGQALMEGIMMRGPHLTTMALRRADGTIYTETTVNAKPSIWNKIPFVRGVVNFVQSMTSGSKTLMRSADIAIEDEERLEKERLEREKKIEETGGIHETISADIDKYGMRDESITLDYDPAIDCDDEEDETSETEAETSEAAEAVEAIEPVEAIEEDTNVSAAEAECAAEETAEAVEPVEAAEVSEETAETEAAAEVIAEEIAAEPAEVIADTAPVLDAETADADESVSEGETAPDAEPEKAADDNEPVDLLSLIPNKPKPAPQEAKAAAPAKKSSAKKEQKKDSGMEGFTFLSVVLGIGLAALLFIFLPTWCYTGIMKIPGAEEVIGGPVWKSVIEGVIKMTIFILYILLCTTMKEIRRVFEYHGAEHKTIFCYEAGEELTVENVKKYKRFHPRCGTSFIVLTVLVGILSGIAISWFLPQFDNTWLRPLIKIAILPVVMGVGYELLKLCGKHDNIITRIIRAPGLWVQRITTREPDDGQIECAIAALKPVIPENGEDMA